MIAMSANTRILSINGGSSSIKVALFESGKPIFQLLSGSIDRIGLDGASFEVKALNAEDSFATPIVAPNYAAAVNVLMQWMDARRKQHLLAAVGHRIVQGGPRFHRPQRITDDMLKELVRFSPFDPEHLPAELMLIAAVKERFPQIPQVACFDTDFHYDLPRVASMLPIPRCYEVQGVRRYGFHGLSYQFLMQELQRLAGTEVAQGRVILAHLGSGASLAAVRSGKSIDTSMGFTPSAGVPMSTRAGDFDPGLVGYLASTENMTADQFHEMVTFKSGLLGISETSSDMHDLLEIETQDVRAAEAVAMFCYEVKKRIGSYAAALGGVDTLVFAGGIGENSPVVRDRICEGLQFLGIELDTQRNAEKADVISSAAGRVAVRVICTNEQQMIAEMVCQVLDVGISH